ncbi:MAG TPA: discoidin domain-containing protein [Acidobacteriota bacterium]|nr:discoidin domain-containing protein [Acidobacteriota bacterium]
MKKCLGSLAVLGLGLAILVPAVLAQDAGKEVLKIQLPKPMFVGTPKNIRTPNLETVTGRPRGPFMVPAGTVLLSAGKPVTSSDKEPVIGEISYVTDGKKSGEDGYYVELGPMLQWVQIDLGKSQELAAIVAWHYHSQARVYRDVIVQVSDDKDFISGVTTVFNNDHDNTAGLGAGKDKEYIETFDGKLFDPKGVKARYVRLYSSGNTSNDMNHYVEVEVYGLPAK